MAPASRRNKPKTKMQPRRSDSTVALPPLIRKRLIQLVGKSSHNPSPPPGPEEEGEKKEELPESIASFLPIQTAQALLSRDPPQLSSCLGVPLRQVLNLRAQVADAAIGTSPTGRDAARVVARVSLLLLRNLRREKLRRRKRQSRSNNPEDKDRTFGAASAGNVDDAIDGEPDELQHEISPSGGSALPEEKRREVTNAVAGGATFDERRGRREVLKEEEAIAGGEDLSLFHSGRPPPLFVGAATALDHAIHHSVAQYALIAVSTGSVALDRLLASCPELSPRSPYCTVDISCAMFPRENHKKRRRSYGDIPTAPGNCDGAGGCCSVSSGSGEGGGVAFGVVTEAVGVAASGKTQLALTLASRAAGMGLPVHYLAAGGNAAMYSLTRRIVRILSSSSALGPVGKCFGQGPLSNPAKMSILRRIHFKTVSNGYALLSTLSALEEEADRDCNEVTQKHSGALVIFDSASGCLSPYFLGSGPSTDGGVGVGLTSDIGFALRRLARVRNYAVFVTNGTVRRPFSNGAESGNVGGGAVFSSSWMDGLPQPALGGLWRAADVRIHLDVMKEDDDDSGGGGGVSCVLATTAMLKVKATLSLHHAKSCFSLDDGRTQLITTEFGIGASGITDIFS